MKGTVGNVPAIRFEQPKIERVAFKTPDWRSGNLTQHQQRVADIGADIENGKRILTVLLVATDDPLEVAVIIRKVIQVINNRMGPGHQYFFSVELAPNDLLVRKKIDGVPLGEVQAETGQQALEYSL